MAMLRSATALALLVLCASRLGAACKEVRLRLSALAQSRIEKSQGQPRGTNLHSAPLCYLAGCECVFGFVGIRFKFWLQRA